MHNFILIGFKNSGKTSVGKLLAERLRYQFLDTDQLIEQKYDILFKKKLTVREIYQQHGEDFFRALENKIIINLKPNNSRVIATGGGSVLKSENIKYLKLCGYIIYLAVDIDILSQRMFAQTKPAFLEKNLDLANFYQQRELYYRQTANVTVAITNESITEITHNILNQCGVFYGE